MRGRTAGEGEDHELDHEHHDRDCLPPGLRHERLEVTRLVRPCHLPHVPQTGRNILDRAWHRQYAALHPEGAVGRQEREEQAVHLRRVRGPGRERSAHEGVGDEQQEERGAVTLPSELCALSARSCSDVLSSGAMKRLGGSAFLLLNCHHRKSRKISTAAPSRIAMIAVSESSADIPQWSGATQASGFRVPDSLNSWAHLSANVSLTSPETSVLFEPRSKRSSAIMWGTWFTWAIHVPQQLPT